MTTVCSEKKWLLLSHYLAGALSKRQVEILESRLSTESDLADALLQLNRIKSLLASLPQKPIPHNFTISSKTLPTRQITRLFPAFRLATAICSILFILSMVYGTYLLPLSGNQILRMSAPRESQQSAPKAAISSEDEASATVEANLGASPRAVAEAPALPLSEQESSSDEEYVEEPVTSRHSPIPWVQIGWILGGLSLSLAAVTIFFYIQERV